MTAGDRIVGSVWATRRRDQPTPSREETRILAAAADQLAGAIERERLADEAMSAEVARRSDALKSALLDSVSHDLRTPLASIRAAAGSLHDPDVVPTEAQRMRCRRSHRPGGGAARSTRAPTCST